MQQQKAAAEKLTLLLRACQLSRSFAVVVMDKLPWFQGCAEALSVLRLLHGSDHLKEQDVKGQLPTSWMLPQRAGVQEELPMRWTVTKAELDDLHARAATGGATLSLPTLCRHGLLWKVSVELDSQQLPLLLCLKYCSAFPRALSEALPPVLLATYKLMVSKSSDPQHHGVYRHPEGIICRNLRYATCDSFLGVPNTQEPRAHSYPPDEFWRNGKLHFQLRLKMQ